MKPVGGERREEPGGDEKPLGGRKPRDFPSGAENPEKEDGESDGGRGFHARRMDVARGRRPPALGLGGGLRESGGREFPNPLRLIAHQTERDRDQSRGGKPESVPSGHSSEEGCEEERASDEKPDVDESRVVRGETNGDQESSAEPSSEAVDRRGSMRQEGDDHEIEEMSRGGGELEEKQVLGETGDEEIEQSRKKLRPRAPTAQSAREIAHGEEREGGKKGAVQLQPQDGGVEQAVSHVGQPVKEDRKWKSRPSFSKGGSAEPHAPGVLRPAGEEVNETPMVRALDQHLVHLDIGKIEARMKEHGGAGQEREIDEHPKRRCETRPDEGRERDDTGTEHRGPWGR